MKVYKFGGASVKDAAGVRNVARIMELDRNGEYLIVVSAMGKTTNELELLCEQYVSGDAACHQTLSKIRDYHETILGELFPENQKQITDEIANTFIEIEWMLEDDPHPEYDFNYDQIVSIGELVSSKIVEAYLRHSGLTTKWIDARSYIHTDNNYREGNVDWEKTNLSIGQLSGQLSGHILVTQGFIGGTSENYTTTLGREGSDYSAAIFARGLSAESLTIWKDVPGVLNCDPKLFDQPVKFTELPYSEALEMTYYGATVIHPKTIKPLQNFGIPLFVRPFLNPEENGTCIHKDAVLESGIASIIVKKGQTLLSVSSRDYSFIDEEVLSIIFKNLTNAKIKLNMMQVSALSFSCCIDSNEGRFKKLLSSFESNFKVRYNSGLELITIRHYKREQLAELLGGREIILEQFSRNTAQFVIK